MRAALVEAVDLDLLAWPGEAGGVILVTATDGAGRSGYGEIAMAPGRLGLAEAMAGAAIERDPFDLHRLRALWARLGGAAAVAVAGALETALVDLQARQLGQPLVRMLGGSHAHRLPLAVPLPVGGAMTEAAELLAAGVRALIVASTGVAADDLRQLGALRRALDPEVSLRLDVAGRLSVTAAQRLMAGCGDLWPEVVIDPAATLAAAGRLRDGAGAPLGLGRSITSVEQLAEAIRAAALDLWVADPLTIGGPAAFVRAAALCRTFAIDIALDARGRTEIGATFFLHLAAAHRVANRAVVVSAELARGEGILAGGLEIDHGHARLPAGPGLGITPDPAAVARLRRSHLQVTEPVAARGAS